MYLYPKASTQSGMPSVNFLEVNRFCHQGSYLLFAKLGNTQSLNHEGH